MLSGVKGRNKASCYGFAVTNQNEGSARLLGSISGFCSQRPHINANKARMAVLLAGQGAETGLQLCLLDTAAVPL